MVRIAVFAILLLTSGALPCAQSQNPASDSRELDAFLTRLQRASQTGDRDAIAAMIRYPLTIAIGGLRVPFANAPAFLERYDDIFNPPLRDAIARDLGHVIAAKDVAVESVNGELRITSIRVPDFEEAAAAPIPAPAGASRGVVRPRRVAIRVGPRPTQIPGLLARDATDLLILYLPKGKLASVRLERVPPGAAVIRVVHAATGAPLATRPSADGRFVSGRPPENGDYRIDVRRIDKTDEAHLPYMLSLSLR